MNKLGDQYDELLSNRKEHSDRQSIREWINSKNMHRCERSQVKESSTV